MIAHLEPRELILELSHNCNLSCAMCGFVKERNRPEYFMTESTLRLAISAFTVPPEVVRLNGRGESTIHPHFEEYLSLIRQSWPNASLHLFTNLSTRHTPRIEMLKTYGVQLFISIDSSDPGELAEIRKGAKWEHIEKNLSTLAGHQPRPFFVFTIQAGNLHRIVDMAHLARRFEYGLIYNVVRHDAPNHRLLNLVLTQFAKVRANLQEARMNMAQAGLLCFIPDQIHGLHLDLAEATKTNGSRSICPALKRETCIQYDGYVTPCNMFHPQRLGHISEGSITQILDGHHATEFRNNHKNSSYCKNCAWLGSES
jgi:MoaA/NifB/PqqE/SkfB family radical SAM enzyme